MGGAVDASGVFVSSTTNGTYSVAMLGGVTGSSATNSLAIGRGAQATLSDSVALGSGAAANRAAGVAGEYKPATVDAEKAHVWTSTHNAIAVGSDDSSNPVTRQIIGVAAGSEDTDAVNVAQLKASTTNMQGITRTETGTPGESGYVATTTIENTLSVSSDGKVHWGNGAQAVGDYSTAIGAGSVANAENSVAMLGGTTASTRIRWRLAKEQLYTAQIH